MNEGLIEKQKKALLAHMKDYQIASQLSKNTQTVIFNKHKLPEGGYGPGLHDELRQVRIAFAKEWGMNGWRNEHFVKCVIAEAQRPTEEQVDDMHRQYHADDSIGQKVLEQKADATSREQGARSADAREFLNHLDETAQKQKNRLKPGMS